MNKRALVDLTALLDVVLILFFAAMINISNTSSEAVNEAEAQVLSEQEQVAALSEDLDNIQIELMAQDEELEASSQLINELQNQLKESQILNMELEANKNSEVDQAYYEEIVSKISVIEVGLVGEYNELYINNQETNINIVRQSLVDEGRREVLNNEVIDALNWAIDNRDKSDIIFIKVYVYDREVYKYAYDFLIDSLDQVIDDYGRDKIMLSKVYE